MPKRDEMTPAERISTLLAGEPIDRIPFCPFDMSCGATGFSAVNVGYPIADIYDNAEKSFWAQVWTQEQYDHDSSPMFGYGSYGGWEFGGEIKLPAAERGQAPSISRYPVESEEDIDGLKLPDVRVSGMLPLAMRFSKMQEQSTIPIVLSCATPFTLAGNIAGVDKLSRWTIKKPELVHKLLRLSTDHILQVIQHWVESFGTNLVTLHDMLPTESNQIISPRHFEEFAFPYLREVHERALAVGIQRFVVHICGEQNMNLPLLAQIPLGESSVVSFGHEVDLSTAIQYFGDRCIIAGNVNPTVIQTGTAQQVYEASKQCIEKGKDAPLGYILAAGCDIPPLAPPYNLYAMIKAVKDFGWYEQ